MAATTADGSVSAGSRPLVVYVDIDDTLVRSVGATRIPIPAVIRHVKELREQGAELYLWSSGGADARWSAEELAIAWCFAVFLPKPQVPIDDQEIGQWRGLIETHPADCDGQSVDEYERRLHPDR